MAEDFFDIVFVADPRFPGGTSTAIATEVKAAHQAGFSAAFLPVLSPLLKQARPMHSEISEALAKTQTPMIGPKHRVETRIAILHHPLVFDRLPAEPLPLRAQHSVVVLHHPPIEGNGKIAYDPTNILQTVGLMTGTKPWLAPVGPFVRAQLQGVEDRTLSTDWLNLIDIEDWPDQSIRLSAPLTGKLRIGRHSRPHPPKWPGTLQSALAAYPDAPDLHVSMLGADPTALARRYNGTCPPHWHCLPFASQPVQEYLSQIDAWVYFHGSDWIEAFGRAILEAAASGLPVLLHPQFRPLFGPAALYCRPEEVADTLADLRADDTARGIQARRARSHIGKTFGLSRYAERLDCIDPGFAKTRRAKGILPIVPQSAPPPLRRLGADRVMMMTSNGVGLGHLTRLLAIAEANPGEPPPVFFTLSRGAQFVREAGFACEYSPFHRGLGIDVESWNTHLAITLTQSADFHQTGVFVFDGNMPYQGVLDFLAARPQIRSVWVRRGFWRDTHDAALDRGPAFDLILSPGDIADILDTGPTAHDSPANQIRVPPLWRIPPGPSLDRGAARLALGLPQEGTCALVSLGSMVNNDLGSLPAQITGAISRAGALPVILRSPLEPEGILPPNDATVRTIYPITPLIAAFDFGVSAAGYNSFHEFTALGLPTVWVPNEAEEMDRQELRARFSWITGCGEALRASDLMRVEDVVRRMCDPSHRAALRERALGVTRDNGATEAYRLIADLSCCVVMGR